jgi:hypothetical protein
VLKGHADDRSTRRTADPRSDVSHTRSIESMIAICWDHAVHTQQGGAAA